LEKGLIHLYCGEGKGKTTASLGLITRSCGAGYQVIIMQCFKGRESSEIRTLEKIPNVTIVHADLPTAFTWELSDDAKEKIIRIHNRMFQEAVSLILSDRQTLLVLDEIIGATTYGYIDKEMVLSFLKEKPDGLEVVLTGRNPLPEFVQLSDYVSDIHKVKHPYDRGIEAREGIEY
jgi:cob(I)alamin adenosyltransferase